MPLESCTNCGRPAKRPESMRGWCNACYDRWLALGKPDSGPGPHKKMRGMPVAYEGDIICRTCETSRPHTDFPVRPPGKYRRTDCKFCMRSRARVSNEEVKFGGSRWMTRRNGILRRKYGITQTDFEALVASQEGKCAICGEIPEIPRSSKVDRKRWTGFQVDHNHVTGAVRGLLCIRCNTTLGHVESIGWHAFRQYLDMWDPDARNESVS